MDTFLRSFGVFILVKCCGSFNKFNTYFLRSLDSSPLYRRSIFYIVHQRGLEEHTFAVYSTGVFVALSRESRRSETNWKIKPANRTQQVSFDLLIHM